MAFVLEELSDEQRKAMGFGVTREELSFTHVRFVDIWAIDRERDAHIFSTGWGPEGDGSSELHWQGKVILISHSHLGGDYVPAELRERAEKEVGQHISKFFNIYRLTIPYEIKDKLEEIKTLVKEGLNVYGSRSIEYYGRGYTEFATDMKIDICTLIRSEAKPEDVKAHEKEVRESSRHLN